MDFDTLLAEALAAVGPPSGGVVPAIEPATTFLRDADYALVGPHSYRRSGSPTVDAVEQALAKMSIASKIRVATLGTAGQRSILIRESNKLIVMAVVKSPGIGESEVRQYSSYRTLPEEALRYIAKNRDWVKHYSVKLNLVKNPRTPIEFSLRFLSMLRQNDVKLLVRDKNVPGAISKAAKQLVSKRMG